MWMRCSSPAAVRVLYVSLCLWTLQAGGLAASEKSGCDCHGIQGAGSPAAGVHAGHDGQAGTGLRARGYAPRLNSTSERLANIRLYFPAEGEYLVSVNGVQHRVTGTQLDLSTGIASRSGTFVTLEVRRVRGFQQRLVLAAQQTGKGAPADADIVSEQLTLSPEPGLPGQVPVRSTTLQNGQLQLLLLGGQHLQFAVR